MHFHYILSAAEILWTLTFAAELVLLVVLLGRDRAGRFPWFTLYIVVLALLLLTTKLLFGRMAPIPSSAIFLGLTDAAAILAFIVVFELARRAFAGASGRSFLVGGAIMLVLAGALVAFWGSWPAWKTLTGGSVLANLRTMQMFAEKSAIVTGFLDLELAVAVLLFGRHYHGGSRSHPLQIVLGLSTAGLSQLAVRGIWQAIATHTTVHSQAQYERIMAVRDRMYHANNVVFLCVLIWWIVWLWLDEAGSQSPDEGQARRHPVAAGNWAARA